MYVHVWTNAYNGILMKTISQYLSIENSFISMSHILLNMVCGSNFFLQVHQSWDMLSWILLYGHVKVSFYNRLKM